MERELIENILQETKDFDFKNQKLITEDTRKRFSDYFTEENQGPLNEKIISDESLFRDYSRLGDRKVDFERVRNPFNLSKYTISSYEKTWFIKDSHGKIEGAYNSYEMDGLFKKGEIKKHTKIGINNLEFFRFDYFVEIVYPLPRVKGHLSSSNYNGKNKNYNYNQPRFDNLSNIQETLSNANNSSVKNNNSTQSTPFKRTPFKVMPNEIFKAETIVRENISTDNSKWLGHWSTSKKHNPNQKSGLIMVGESFLVKSKTKNKNKYIPRSSKDTFKLEMNDIIGNYTAIKKDKDFRKYVDLSKKIDFQSKLDVNVIKESEEVPEDIDDFDFDNIGFSKKD